VVSVAAMQAGAVEGTNLSEVSTAYVGSADVAWALCMP
jgi:hypothetical protein